MAILSPGLNNYMEHFGSPHTAATKRIYCFYSPGKAVMDFVNIQLVDVGKNIVKLVSGPTCMGSESYLLRVKPCQPSVGYVYRQIFVVIPDQFNIILKTDK